MAVFGQCPGLDIEQGVDQFGGSEEVYFSILRYFVADMDDLLKAMSDPTVEGLEEYAKTAHAIKGASRNVFASAIGNAAEAQEKAAKEGDFAFIAVHNAAFLADAKQLVNDIEAMLGTSEAS